MPLIRLLPAVLACLLLAACATRLPLRDDPELARCQTLFVQSDAEIAAAGAGDASLHRLPGFPYLRSTRFWASFAGELETPVQWQAWTAELRGEDQGAREDELLRASGRGQLDDTLYVRFEALADCGARLLKADLADPARREALRRASQVPDDYATAARVVGAYPLAVPFLKWGIRGYQREVAQAYAEPLAARPPVHTVLWEPQPSILPPARAGEIAEWIASGAAHPLGVPQFDDLALQRLFQTFAPAWWVEQTGPADRPGAPYLDGERPRLDPSVPQTYILLDFTRVGGQVLPQLVYWVWFAERPPQGRFDPYAGTLDGVLWRVTLGADGRPLAYDSIHPCGCFHFVYPARETLRPRANRYWQEPVLRPQTVTDPGPLALRIASGDHQLLRVVPLAEARADEAGRYRLAPYGDLTFLPDQQGAPRSLFRAGDGIVSGTERGERYWLWPSGVPDPGAMRAWGRHATAFVGVRHFDDPRLLETLFEWPPGPEAP